MAGDPLALLNMAGQSALALPGTLLNMSTRHVTEGVGVLSNEVTKAGAGLAGAGLPVLGQGLPALPVLGQGLPNPFAPAAPAAAPATGSPAAKRAQSVQMTSYLER
jgi:hypothetical protein